MNYRDWLARAKRDQIVRLPPPTQKTATRATRPDEHRHAESKSETEQQRKKAA